MDMNPNRENKANHEPEQKATWETPGTDQGVWERLERGGGANRREMQEAGHPGRGKREADSPVSSAHRLALDQSVRYLRDGGRLAVTQQYTFAVLEQTKGRLVDGCTHNAMPVSRLEQWISTPPKQQLPFAGHSLGEDIIIPPPIQVCGI
jgi:hypothetical protein